MRLKPSCFNLNMFLRVFFLSFLISWNVQSGDDVPSPQPVTVYAASSLTAAFEDMKEAFQSQNPGIAITLSFGGSQQLRTQLELGARADLYVAADERQMILAQKSGIVREASELFAQNTLIVILPNQNSAKIEALQDLAKPGIKIVLAAPEVPVGNYSRLFLEKAAQQSAFPTDYKERVLANVVSEEPNVKQVAAKVQLDEADAGIVYGTDLTPEVAGKLKRLEIPAELNQLASYYIAVTKTCPEPKAAGKFIEFILAEPGQKILSNHGFIRVPKHH
ncbi:molybdate ABC transporter substrate-binding protein [bacterium]|nr:molybdate ABC transporter substrate-binding protein [bacterium]